MGYSIGTNLGNLNYFNNIVKQASQWQTWDPSTNAVSTTATLPIDGFGYVTSLPPNIYAQTSISGAGAYVLSYSGEGAVYIKNKLVANGGVVTLNGRTRLEIRTVNPSNYLTNLSLALQGSSGATFTAEALSHIKPFKSYRFMDFMATNGTFYATQDPGDPERDKSANGNWNTRAVPNDCFWRSSLGVPLEVMVELCNITYCEPWFNIPTEADDTFITNFATYIRDNLDPRLNIYVEYSNEAPWGGFGQRQWMREKGQALGISAISYFGKRTTQICQIFDQIFGTDKARVKGVMAGQSTNYRVLQELLQYKWDPSPKPNSFYGIDCIAIAPYFSIKLNNQSPTPTLRHQFLIDAWNNDADKGMAKIFQSLEFGTGLPPSGFGATGDGAEGMLRSFENIGQHYRLAQDYGGLQLVCYEGGQGLSQLGNYPYDDITAQFIMAQTDPRMYTMYIKYFTKVFQLGVSRFMHFSDASTWGWFGSWGASNKFNLRTPKYDALVDLIGSYTSPTPPPVQKTVSIVKTTDGKEVGSTPTVFTLTRLGDAATTVLNVNYTLTGTATVNVDYSDPSMGTVQFAIGQITTTITLPTINDAIIEPSETIIATITLPTGYIINGSSSAIATIVDSGVSPTPPPPIVPPTKPRTSRYNIQLPDTV